MADHTKHTIKKSAEWIRTTHQEEILLLTHRICRVEGWIRHLYLETAARTPGIDFELIPSMFNFDPWTFSLGMNGNGEIHLPHMMAVAELAGKSLGAILPDIEKAMPDNFGAFLTELQGMTEVVMKVITILERHGEEEIAREFERQFYRIRQYVQKWEPIWERNNSPLLSWQRWGDLFRTRKYTVLPDSHPREVRKKYAPPRSGLRKQVQREHQTKRQRKPKA